MTEEDALLMGLPPAATSNGARAVEIMREIIDSPAIFSRPGEPSNTVKMEFIRQQFECPTCAIHEPFPYIEVFHNPDPAKQQAASFLCDLRCQYIERALQEKIVPPLIGSVLYLRNRTWYVKYREQLGLSLLAAQREESGVRDDA